MATEAKIVIMTLIKTASKNDLSKTSLDELTKAFQKCHDEIWEGGVYENFGQREISALKDKYGYNPYPTTGREIALKRDIDELNNWCMNYTGNP